MIGAVSFGTMLQANDDPSRKQGHYGEARWRVNQVEHRDL